MNIVALIIQLVSGAVGGNVVGGLAKKISLGPVGNSIVGILGGGLGGLILQLLGMGGAEAGAAEAGQAAATGGLDLNSILASIGGGGVGGGILMAIVGYIKKAMAPATAERPRNP
jgi:hypothetical protein